MHIAREVYAADDDLASVRHSLPLAARFVALTKRRGEHLLWAGCRHPSGCGRFWLGASEGRWTSPRRASWAIAHGRLGRGQRVWRRRDVCDEPECVAPGHLTLLSPTAQRPPRARQVRPPLAPEVVVRIAGSVQTGAVVNLER